MVCDAWEEPPVTSATRGTTQQRKRRATCQCWARFGSMAIRSRRLRAQISSGQSRCGRSDYGREYLTSTGDSQMKTYEPLKSPEIRRDENGRFDRHGKSLAKTQKKTGLTNKLIKKSDGNQSPREPDGRYKNGGARPGAGRPKGSPNKLSHSLKEMILASLDDVGGRAYLARLAIENSSAYASLIGKVLPTTLATSESNGGNVEIRFIREIVHPSGYIESDDRPKQLPAPDASTDDTNEGAA